MTHDDTIGRSHAVVFDQVTKSFGDKPVLRAVDLRVRPGEKISLIGPSGSGKTTILRILAGLERPDDGRVHVFDKPLWHVRKNGTEAHASMRHVRASSRDVGLVFQMFNLFPHMTVLRNIIEAPVRALKVPKARAEEEARELLDMVGLADVERSYPAQLSGGQQQRVAIARTLATHPKILLFDEVTSALDPELVGEVLDVVRRLAERSEVTMLIVTHEMSFARRVSERVLVLDDGRIIEDGRPSQVFGSPACERTRQFLSAVLHPLGDDERMPGGAAHLTT